MNLDSAFCREAPFAFLGIKRLPPSPGGSEWAGQGMRIPSGIRMAFMHSSGGKGNAGHGRDEVPQMAGAPATIEGPLFQPATLTPICLGPRGSWNLRDHRSQGENSPRPPSEHCLRVFPLQGSRPSGLSRPAAQGVCCVCGRRAGKGVERARPWPRGRLTRPAGEGAARAAESPELRPRPGIRAARAGRRRRCSCSGAIWHWGAPRGSFLGPIEPRTRVHKAFLSNFSYSVS